jgi:hypothetical protein
MSTNLIPICVSKIRVAGAFFSWVPLGQKVPSPKKMPTKEKGPSVNLFIESLVQMSQH